MEYYGMNWIRKEKRLAIYLRDGLACVYCGQGVEDSITLTLDHLEVYNHHAGAGKNKSGANEPDNLVTACLRCNSVRGDRPWRKFAGHAAKYINHGVTAAKIIAHVLQTTKRVVDVNAAKELMARRGGFTAALKAARKARA